MTNRYKKEFYIQARTRRHTALNRFVFERNGEFGFGPKSIATKFRGRIDAERVRHIVSAKGIMSRSRTKVVRA